MRKFDSMLEDFSLKVFVTLVQQKSFTKTAEQLHVTQPTVSQNISGLESQLNVKLFQRQRGETVLTEAGEVFYRYAEKVLADYEMIAKDFAQLQPSQVKVSASEEVFDYMVSDLLADFTKIHPEISFLKTFSEDADLHAILTPDKNKRGTFALSFSPSVSFAVSRLWSVLSDTLTRQLL